MEAIEIMVEIIEVVKNTDEIRPEIQTEPGGGRQTDLSVMTQIWFHWILNLQNEQITKASLKALPNLRMPNHMLTKMLTI